MESNKQPKHTKRHSTAIRRNTELHALVFGQIAAEQERAGVERYKQILALRHSYQQLIGRITT